MPMMMIEQARVAVAPPPSWMSDEDWLAARRKVLTATDAPAVLGVHPWRSPMRVFGEKRGLTRDVEETLRMEVGTFLEPKVAELFMRERGAKVRLPETRLTYHPRHPWMAASLDRNIEDPLCGLGLLEIKTTGLPVTPESLPIHWQVQVQHQLEVTGLSWGYIAVLVGNEHYFSVAVERNERFIAELVKKLEAFWRDHVVAGVPPAVDGSYDTRDALGEIHRAEEAREVRLPAESAAWAAKFRQAGKEVRRWMAAKNEAGNAISAAMGTARAALAADGTRFTWRTQKQRASCKRTLRIEDES